MKMFSRLLHAAAICVTAVLGVSTAKAADNVWQGDDDCYWSTSANWSNYSGGDYWVINGSSTSRAIKFTGDPIALGYTLAIVATDVTFSSDETTAGFYQTVGDIRLGAWATGALTINSGTHVINELAVASAWWNNTGAVDGTLTIAGGNTTVNTTTWVGSGQDANASGTDGIIKVNGGNITFVGKVTLGCVANTTGTINLNSGTATAATIVESAGTGAINFNGGTLAASAAGTLIGSGITVTVNGNGGTLATGGNAITIDGTFTGSGTLNITGGGSVTFTTAPTCKVVTTDGTTVTGATLLTAVSVTAPSSDWSSKTLPIAAYAQTATGSWSVYTDGGTSTQQTLGSDTAYVAVVDVDESLTTPPTIAGVANTTSGNTYTGFDAYTIVNDGTAGDVVGGFIVSSGKAVNFTGSLLTQLQGDAVAANVCGGCYPSSYSGVINGNVGISIIGNAQVSGSVVGSCIATGSRSGTLNGNSSIFISSLQSTSSSTTFGDTGIGSSTGYIVGGGVVKDVAYGWSLADMTGNATITVDLPDTAEGAFVKAIVGGMAQLRNHKTSCGHSLTGSTSVSIDAPSSVTFANTIVGGGYGIRHSSNVTGDSSVTINGGTYTGTIYAGGYGESYAGPCTVGGNATLTIGGGVFNGATLAVCGPTDSVTGTSTLAIKGDVDLSTSSIGAFDTLTIASGVTVTISASQVDAFETYGAAVSENEGVYTATASYKWAGSDGANWSDASNWTIGGVAATTAPTADDPVMFSSDCTVTVNSSECYAKQIVANAVVTFSGNPIIVTGGVSGSGSVVLGDGAGFAAASASATIDVGLSVSASSTAPAVITNTASGFGFVINGSLSGSGYITLTGTSHCTRLYGDNTAFAGYITIENFGATGLMNYSKTGVDHTSAASAAATWTVNYSGNNFLDCDKDVTPVFKFGWLTGSISESNASSHYPVIYEVGALCDEGETMELTYWGINNTARASIFRMVGSGTFAVTGNRVRGYYLDAGTTYLKSNALIPGAFATFNGGTLKLDEAVTSDPSAVLTFVADKTATIDDGGVDRTFATAIGSSVAADFVKQGAGTLTLSVAPTYTGATTVEAGALILPTGSSYTLGTDTVVDSSYTDGIKLVPATSMTATVGGVGYATLAAAVAAATADDTVVLCQDVTLTESIAITSSDVTLDLAGHNISIGNGTDAVKAPFYVQGVKFTVTNSSETASAITELVANYGPIMAFGVTNADAANGKTTEVVIGANVTVSGWAGVFVNTYASSYAAYVAENDYANIKVTINGTAIGRTDNYEGTGVGVYVNGNCTNTTYPVTLTVNGTATGTGGGVYAAGYTVTTIGEGATLTGGECGIEQRAGSLTINGGAISSTAQTYSAVSNGSGSSVVGAAVAINQHNTGLGVALTINGGTFSGPQAVSITDTESQGTDNVTASITGGTFTSTTGDADITTVVPAVSGGTFSKTVAAAACAAGFVPVTTADSSGKYTVETGLMITEGSLLGKKLTIADTSFFPAECDTAAEQAVYLNTQQANGYYGWQNYVMNADGTTVLAPTYTASGTTITLAPSFGTARTGAGVGVAYTYETSTDGSTWTSSDATIDTESDLTAGTQKFFRIKATFSAE